MKNTLLLSLILLINLFGKPANVVTPGLYITSPLEGQVIQGVVEVQGSIPDGDFAYAELSYAFEESDSANWFIISRIDTPIQDGILAFWDTTTITDGIYRIRLAVYQTDGDSAEVIIKAIRVGNYTQYDTATPAPVSVDSTATPQQMTPTLTAIPEPTDFLENPASISQEDIAVSTTSAIIIILLGIVIVGIYLFFRSVAKK